MSEEEKTWILITGSLVDTTKGGGFEFFGPCTEAEVERAFERSPRTPYKLKLQLLRMPKGWTRIDA